PQDRIDKVPDSWIVLVEGKGVNDQACHPGQTASRSYRRPCVAAVLLGRLAWPHYLGGAHLHSHPAPELTGDRNRAMSPREEVERELEQITPVLGVAADFTPVAWRGCHFVKVRVAECCEPQRFKGVLPLRTAYQFAEEAETRHFNASEVGWRITGLQPLRH